MPPYSIILRNIFFILGKLKARNCLPGYDILELEFTAVLFHANYCERMGG